MMFFSAERSRFDQMTAAAAIRRPRGAIEDIPRSVISAPTPPAQSTRRIVLLSYDRTTRDTA